MRHIIADYDLFMIEWKRFRDSFLNQYSPARKNRNAGEKIEIEKENKEKVGSVCLEDTRPPESPPAAPQPIGPSAYETTDLPGEYEIIRTFWRHLPSFGVICRHWGFPDVVTLQAKFRGSGVGAGAWPWRNGRPRAATTSKRPPSRIARSEPPLICLTIKMKYFV